MTVTQSPTQLLTCARCLERVAAPVEERVSSSPCPSCGGRLVSRGAVDGSAHVLVPRTGEHRVLADRLLRTGG